MAILEIKKFKDPVLRKRCKKIRKVNDKIKSLIVNMVQTMEEGHGIGLAAPQVGVSKRVIVVKADFRGQRILALINPKITKRSRKKEKGEEGCLSFPGIFLEIKRAEEIRIKAININGEKINLKVNGILARVFQHEVDHLNGILFYSRLGPIKRIIFKLKGL